MFQRVKTTPHTKKRGSALLLCLLLAPALCVPCRAAEPPQVSAHAWVLVEAESGRVLLAHNEAQQRSIASTTKLMTALVALEHGMPGECVTVKPAHLVEGSSMYLRAGEELTLEALLYGLLLASGNDAAECIADHCGGDVAIFVGWMNEKAAALGMTNTHFANPSGLDAPGHYSCALDMARLAAAVLQNPVLLRITATKSAAVGERMLSNHNKLLAQRSDCIGLKTGYTGDAGRTLVTACERGGMRLLCVTLNDGNDWADHSALHDFGFSAYTRTAAVRAGESFGAAAVTGGEVAEVPLAAAEDFFWPLGEGEVLDITAQQDELCAPVRAGDAAGELIVSLNGQELGRVPLVAAQEVAEPAPEPGFFARLLEKLRSKGE